MTRHLIPGCGIIVFRHSSGGKNPQLQDNTNALFTSNHSETLPAELPANEIVHPSFISTKGKTLATQISSNYPPSSPDLSVQADQSIPTPSNLEADITNLVESIDLPSLSTTASVSSSLAEMESIFDINHSPPFYDPMVTLGTQAYDVLKILNVPFGVTIPEIKSFVSRLTTSPLIRDHQQGYPVHIIMERSTGKTMDCFVEFQHKLSALAAFRKAEQIHFEGKILKMGTRHVDVEMSSEGELCAALFPKAKSVQWDPETGVPTIKGNLDPFSEGFQGFLTVEEISSLCRHAAMPHKSSFSQRCPQRVYESMISTLYKFPWHVPVNYSVNTRNFLWTAYMELLHNLVARVQPQTGVDRPLYGNLDKQVGLNHNLLMEFVFAGLNVPMFSLRQKSLIVLAAGPVGAGFPVSRQAPSWPFQSLIPMPDCAPHVVDEWLNIFDIGYEKCLEDGLNHGFEDCLTLERDECGFINVELNDKGRALTFHEIIATEKMLMAFLINQGRIAWCAAWKLPYPLPLQLQDRPSENDRTSALQATVTSLELSRTEDDKDDLSDSSSDGLGSLISNDPSDQDEAEPANKGHSTYFNPRTPSFIPSQLWTTASRARSGSSLPQAANAIHLRTGSSGPPASLPPNLTSPQVPPGSHRSSTNRTSSGSSKQEKMYEANLYDPFSSHVSPNGPRRTSLGSHRSASVSPANSDTLPTRYPRSRSDESMMQHHMNELNASQPYQAINGHGWGYPLYPTKKQIFPSTRTPADFDKPRNNKNDSSSPSELDTAGSASLPPKPSPSADPWAFGSPSHGRRSRSSTGRKPVYIQATINEEGDWNARESRESTNNDAADTGGVRI